MWFELYKYLLAGVCEIGNEINGKLVVNYRPFTQTEKANLKLEILRQFEKELEGYMDPEGNLGTQEVVVVRQNHIDGN